MKNRILPLLFLLIFGFVLLCPVYVHAAAIDPEAEASLTLSYQKDAIAFCDLQVDIYRIAELHPDGTFQLIEPFASYPISIQGIENQTQWNHVAQTLWSYIVADGVMPDREGQTDENGMVSFSDLETGLYFVSEVIGETASGTYVFNQFLVYVPTPQPDGSWQYSVEANPKCIRFVPKTQYTVTKLWQDAGNQSNRPEAVAVEIYREGVLQETCVLSADNNWSYTWNVSDADSGKWTVAERNVAEPYTVTIQQNGSHFTVINTSQSQPEPPQTGDIFTPLPWILLMCFSGILLLFLGLYGRRRKW